MDRTSLAGLDGERRKEGQRKLHNGMHFYLRLRTNGWLTKQRTIPSHERTEEKENIAGMLTRLYISHPGKYSPIHMLSQIEEQLRTKMKNTRKLMNFLLHGHMDMPSVRPSIPYLVLDPEIDVELSVSEALIRIYRQ